ncbi:MAG TPA: sulfide/dihydroorotate dehydrogenase-like FAD/NAD-binding protein [Acidimicrobiia bacterium]|nr:sulfide/dihydroorotate dehydrogenase-like FAD/NAD-binding protein [Acidimicrobiia bacterium]
MFPIAESHTLAPDICRIRVVAPRVVEHWAPGQFVILRVDADGERIPLTVADVDRSDGTITLIVQGVGRTTRLLNSLDVGDSISDVAGPFGVPSEIEDYGTVVVVGGGVGTAIAFPTARAMSEAGNRVIVIIGGRTADLVILTDEVAEFADELIVTTDDGSGGRRGLVTDALLEVMDREPVDRVVAIGPIPMMKAVAELTRPDGIATVASLNPIMVDGTGMCGGCRVLVDGSTLFACIDGPEFDAHLVDFDVLAVRNRAYRDFEIARAAGVCS